MLWSRIEIGEWTVGISVYNTFTLHLGPWKLTWIPRGSQLHRDFRRIRAAKKST